MKLSLYASASRPAYVEQAMVTDVDAVVIDLEDSVPQGEKDSARDIAAHLLAAQERNDRTWVRVNAPGSDALHDDLEVVVPLLTAGIRVPGVRTPDEVNEVMEAVRCLSNVSLQVELMIENEQALTGIPELLRGNPEISALTFGGSDYMKDLGTDDFEVIWQAKERLVIAARQHGLPAYDTVFSDLRDPAATYEDSFQAARVGFSGKSIIHPAQIPVTREAFRAAQVS